MISGRKTDAPFPDVFAGWLVLVCCMAMPAFVVISTRSSLAILSGFSFAAALALATRCGRTWLQEMLHSIRTPEGRLILVGFTFSAVSLVWGASGWNGAFALGEVFLAVLSALAFGVVLYHCAPWIRPGQIAAAISAGLLTGAAIFIYLTIIGHPLRSLNRAALSWTVLLWPLVGFLVCRGKGALGALVILAGLALAYLSDSTRSVFGLILGAAVFALATVAPRFASRAFLVMVIVLLIGAPWFGKIVERGMPDSLHSYISMRKASTKERVNVWVGMGILATAHFPKGAGFASSPRADADPAAALVPAEIRPMLAVGHPHNMFLQVWYELGAVGVLVVLGAAFAMHRRLQQLAADAVPAFLGLATVIVAEGYVGHGAWQGWWWAVCGLAAFSLAHCQGLLRPLPAQASAAAVSPPRQARSLARVRTVALSLAVVTFAALFVPPALLYIQHALGAVNRPLAYVFVLQVCLVAVIAFLLVTFLPRREFAITSALQVSTLAFATFAMALLVFRSFYSLAMLFSAFILVVSINAVLASRRTYLNTGGAAVFLSGAEGSLPPNLAHQLRKVTDPSAPVTGVSLVVMDLQRQPAPDWSEYLNRAIAAGIEVVHLPSFLQFHQRWVDPQFFLSTHIRYRLHQRLYFPLKRALDLLVALLLLPLVLAGTCFAFVALLISKWDTIVLLREPAIGLAGKPIEILRLRRQPGHGLDEPADARAGRRWLDRGLELVNVMRGEMSLIGPRPLSLRANPPTKEELDRALVKPGILSWVSPLVPGDGTPEQRKRIELGSDLYYVKKVSFQLDLTTVFRAVLRLAAPADAQGLANPAATGASGVAPHGAERPVRPAS